MESTIKAKAERYGIEFRIIAISYCQFLYDGGTLGCSLENAEKYLETLIFEKGLKANVQSVR